MNVVSFKSKIFGALAILFCAILSISLLGCSGGDATNSQGNSTDEASTNTSESSTTPTKLIVGFDQSYPPYGFIGDDGEYTGFDLDLAKVVCERLGWELELKAIDWDAKDALLEQGQINCIWNGFTKEGRGGSYAFSEPYMLNKQVVVVKADSGISIFDDLKGKVVITQADSAALEVLESEQIDLAKTFARLDQIADYNNAFMQLDSGAVDAVACDLSIALYQMSANPDKYKQLLNPLSTENYAVGFKKGDEGEQMAEKVSECLRKLYNDGTVEDLCNKYASYGISLNNWELI